MTAVMRRGSAETEALRRIVRPDGGSILILTFIDRSDDDQERWMQARVDEMNAMTTPFAMIMDMRGLTTMTPRQRAFYAASRERLRATYARHKVLTAYVVADQRQRGFLTAIGWIITPLATSGREFCNSLREAEWLCHAALDAVPRSP